MGQFWRAPRDSQYSQMIQLSLRINYMPTGPRHDLRPGVTEPVVLMISRRQVEEHDIASVLKELRLLLATREDTWLYRGQMGLAVDGYNDDARELVDIPEVRAFLRALERQWPYWAFFFNQVDDSIKILALCVCGSSYPGCGAVEIDTEKLRGFLLRGFAGMNSLFDQHAFPESELEVMSCGVLEVIEQTGMS